LFTFVGASRGHVCDNTAVLYSITVSVPPTDVIKTKRNDDNDDDEDDDDDDKDDDDDVPSQCCHRIAIDCTRATLSARRQSFFFISASLTINSVSALGTQLSPIPSVCPSVGLSVGPESVLWQYG